ncbi:protoporphyrinogen/coproporphyrinogen oxidase [Streptomyces sp. NPDC056149]|uniref:protoporphyrinogen/coproporphyrinogen oxidase n=1 Tax=Streptomyces sp. NPDC056149 TaxID=3345728 RepID=UPI0035D74C22
MTTAPDKKRVIVVGAGIAGLAAAYRLQDAGYTVTILESEGHVGGRMAAVEHDGYHLALGAIWLPHSYQHMLRLINDAGLAPQILPATDILGMTRQGTVHRLPLHRHSALLCTRLLSWRAKLKASHLMLDALRARPMLRWEDMSTAAAIDTESAHDYARRRLDQELYDYLVEPLCVTWYYADPREVSAIGLFLALWALIGYGAFTFPQGASQLPQLLAEQLPVELNAHVTAVEEASDGVHVHWQRRDELHTEHAAASVLAVPGTLVPKITPGLPAPQRDYLSQLTYQPDVRVSFGLTSPPAEPSGLVFLGGVFK